MNNAAFIPSVQDQQDRLVTPRFSGSIPCNFLCREGSYSVIAKNLSIDGAFVASNRFPLEGSIGSLVFESEGVVKLSVPSRVNHTEASSQVGGFGLYFLYFGEDLLGLLEAIFAS